MSHVELYEALKGPVGEVAARLIADVVPPARDLATRSDIAELRSEIASLRGELRAEIHASTNHTIRWMLGVSVPMWAAIWATLVALLVRT